MNDYRNYGVEKLALDDSFIRWTLGSSLIDAQFWEQWLIDNPDKAATVRQAQQLLLALDEKPFLDLSNEQIRQDIQNVLAQIQTQPAAPRIIRLNSAQKSWLVAATVVLLAGIGWLISARIGPATPGTASISAKPMAIRNQGLKPSRIALADGSVAVLGVKSRLSYTDSSNGQRVVHLTGEAFFDVKRNPNRPFLVYTNDVVTRVLGTRFRVKAYTSDATVRVSVQSGKVFVFARTQAKTVQQPGVVLTPNQETLFSRSAKTFSKQLVGQPLPIDPVLVKASFEFDQVPVNDVINQLAKLYGITIIHDEAVLKDCLLTASLTDEDLKGKLTLICQGIGATYEMVDGQVVIYSSGCH